MWKAIEQLKVSRFNPTLVRLRRSPPGSGSPAALPFQSHAGSIEAVLFLPKDAEISNRFNPTLVRLRHEGRHRRFLRPTREFQSHAGSIEANPWPRMYLPPRTGFNPTLVRLRHQHSADARPRPAWFQSHAGSIEALEYEIGIFLF